MSPAGYTTSSKNVPVVTTAFVLYNEMDTAIRRKDSEDVGFTDKSVRDLERAIQGF